MVSAKLVFRSPILLCALALLPSSPAAIWYVDDDAPTSGKRTSWETAFKTIQQGVNAARDGDAVIVAPGNYPENPVIPGREIRLQSTDPSDPAVVVATIIRGTNGVAFGAAPSYRIDPTIDGFTITESRFPGVNCRTPALVKRCVIRGNGATDRTAGGVYCAVGVQGADVLIVLTRVQGGTEVLRHRLQMTGHGLLYGWDELGRVFGRVLRQR